MSTVEIEYCVPCGFQERAEEIQHELLSRYGERLDRVSLVTGDHGVLRVEADGETVWDKDSDEWNLDDIADRVEERMSR